MSESTAKKDEMLQAEALAWYKKKYPRRNLPVAEITQMYVKLKEYAQSEPLLAEYYRANHISV